MPHRFYCANLPESGTAVLEGVEAHHLIHVLRIARGGLVELFNGAGLVARAEATLIGRRDAEFQLLETHREPSPAREVVLGTAVPKGDRFDWLIEKATELGVTRVVPLVTEHSVVDPRDSKLDKLKSTVIAACKQSGRNHLLQLMPVTKWADFVNREFAAIPSYVAHPGPDALPITSLQALGTASVAFAVGPEGGLTDDEVALAVACGANPINLGPHILRMETAGMVLAALAVRSISSETAKRT
jgi:16S rRNA (uracil1498-N3)-methyltransferase